LAAYPTPLTMIIILNNCIFYFLEVPYLDPLNNERVLKLKVPNGTITLWGGVTAAGLTATAPSGKAVVEITRGSKIRLFRT
jgi:hypothetical protein